MARTFESEAMLGKLHADPGEEEQGTKGQEKSTAKNCSKYQVQSVSPIELPEAFHPSHALQSRQCRVYRA